MEDEAQMIRLGQKAKLEEMEKSNRAKDKEITQLQHDILSQDRVNKDVYSRMLQLENTVADLVGRIAKMEDQANLEDTSTQRATRSKVNHDPQTDEKIKTLAK
jgi:hypothetical protein